VSWARGGPIGAGIGAFLGGSTGYAVGYALSELEGERGDHREATLDDYADGDEPDHAPVDDGDDPGDEGPVRIAVGEEADEGDDHGGDDDHSEGDDHGEGDHDEGDDHAEGDDHRSEE
ncbi:hypothetical protein DJ74_03505, partial [Halorubrum sp. Ea8]